MFFCIRFVIALLVLLVFEKEILFPVFASNFTDRDDAKQDEDDKLAYEDLTIAEDCSKCGITKLRSKPHVMVRGGRMLRDTTSFPWMVSLCRYEANHCGGAILNEYFILTAAHCVTNVFQKVRSMEKVCVQTETPANKSEAYDTEKIVVHPKFKLIRSNTTSITFAQYDIALIKLKKKLTCNEYVNPICLPDADFKLSVGDKSLVLGWGTSSPGLQFENDILHYGNVKHLDFEECVKAVPETTIVENHTLCEGGTCTTVCYGDSGSPLVHRIGDKYHVVGVASSETDKACLPTSPVMYTNVMEFVDWIKNEMEKLLFSKEGDAEEVKEEKED